jgi:hypothetical protein
MRPLAAIVVALAVALVSLPRPVVAAPPAGGERELVEKVNRAIDKGVQFMRANQKGRTWEVSWEGKVLGMEGGVTALATLALLNCGVKPDAKEVATAIDYLRTLPRERTYVVALVTMVMAEARQPRDLPLIQANCDWLLKSALRRGGSIKGWSYPIDGINIPDGSNTQYAVLGLYAAKTAGARVPDGTWDELRKLYLDGQTKLGPDAGYWTYVPNDPPRLTSPPSLTMSVAGVSGLVIAGMGLEASQQKLDPATGVAANCGVYPENDAVARGLNFVGRNFTFAKPQGGQSTYYNVYGIERVGRLSGQRFIGRVDWYREGCEFLVREQNRDGGWTKQADINYDQVAIVSTSFALLFLSKGRTPVLISKLAHGDARLPDNGSLVELGTRDGVVGWNRKHNDARNVTAFASKELFGGMPLGWQVYDPRRRDFARNDEVLAEVGVLVQSPILYLNGHERLNLPGQHKEILKKYVEEGGFVLAEACCGSPAFTESFTALVKELFPDTNLRPMRPDHPIWTSHFAIPPTEFPDLMVLERGCRTAMVLSPKPLAGYWEESKYMVGAEKNAANRGEQAFRLSANIVAYATGMEPPAQRLTARRVTERDPNVKTPPRGFFKPAQLKLPGETPPAPAAMRNLAAYLEANAKLDVVLDVENLAGDSADLPKYKFLYAHGRKAFTLGPAELNGLKANLQTGGLLLADACCGAPAFDTSFREFVAALFPGKTLEPIPPDDDLYSATVDGVKRVVIPTVKLRTKASSAGKDAGFEEVPPQLEGVKIDGRWAIIYSKYDLGCAMEGHKSSDCLGHTRDSALRLAAAAVIYALRQ